MYVYGVYQNHLWGFGNQYMLITCTPTSAPSRDSSAPKSLNAHYGNMPPAEDPILLRATVLGEESKLKLQGAIGGTYLLSEKPQKKMYFFSSISKSCIYPKNCYVLIL